MPERWQSRGGRGCGAGGGARAGGLLRGSGRARSLAPLRLLSAARSGRAGGCSRVRELRRRFCGRCERLQQCQGWGTHPGDFERPAWRWLRYGGWRSPTRCPPASPRGPCAGEQGERGCSFRVSQPPLLLPDARGGCGAEGGETLGCGVGPHACLGLAPALRSQEQFLEPGGSPRWCQLAAEAPAGPTSPGWRRRRRRRRTGCDLGVELAHTAPLLRGLGCRRCQPSAVPAAAVAPPAAAVCRRAEADRGSGDLHARSPGTPVSPHAWRGPVPVSLLRLTPAGSASSRRWHRGPVSWALALLARRA